MEGANKLIFVMFSFYLIILTVYIVFYVILTIYILSCILSSDDTVDRRCKTHINYHTCICIRTAYFSERAAPPSFSLSRNVETFLLKKLFFSTFPEIIVCYHKNTF